MVSEYNEITYAKTVMEDGFQTNKMVHELYIVARYLYSVTKDKDEVRKYIVDFSKKHINGFNEIRYFDKIEDVVSSSSDREPRELGCVHVTDNEISFIKNFSDDKKIQQVIFGYLVVLKVRKAFGQKLYQNIKDSKFAKMCGLYKTSILYDIMNELESSGIIKHTRYLDNEILMEEIEGTPEITVRDIDNCYRYWKMYNGDGKYMECQVCQSIIPRTTNNQKYCIDCSKKINIAKTIEKSKQS